MGFFLFLSTFLVLRTLYMFCGPGDSATNSFQRKIKRCLYLLCLFFFWWIPLICFCYVQWQVDKIRWFYLMILFDLWYIADGLRLGRAVIRLNEFIGFLTCRLQISLSCPSQKSYMSYGHPQVRTMGEPWVSSYSEKRLMGPIWGHVNHERGGGLKDANKI